MKDESQNMGNDLILPGFFATDMINESVIDDFYARELKESIIELRNFMAKEVSEEKLDWLIMSGEDKYSIQKSEDAIKEANILSLQNERSKIEEHINKMNDTIDSLKKCIMDIEVIPKEKSEVLKSEYSLKIILSCIPFIGIFFSLSIFNKIKIFESAFRSTNQIYIDLGKILLVKNKSIIIVNIILGLILSIGSLLALMTIKNDLSVELQYGLPGVLFLLYLLTTGVFSLMGKRLNSYMETTKTTEK